MVQRKGLEVGSPTKAEPPRYTGRQQLQQKKNNASWDQDMRNKLSDLKRMLKKQRSIRRIAEMDDLKVHFGQELQQEQQLEKSSKELPPKPSKPPMAETMPPNYMKPTSSSGARSERSRSQSQSGGIAHPVPTTTDRSNCSGSKHGPNSGTSRPPSPACSGQKPGKMPTRRPGSREVRRSLLFPGVGASKATCSSTLKDSRFPRELELSPGSTEANGTSAMKVCPFTYCSLNGHWHLPLPPLRSFISARRRLLKAQKSVRLKRLSSCRKRCSRRSDEKQQQQLGAEDESHHTDDDFFIEIYADSYRDSAESAVYPSNPEEEEEEEEGYKEEEEEEDDGNLAACAGENNDEDDMNSEIFSELFPNSHQDSAESVIFLSDYEDGNEEDGGGDAASNANASDCDMDSETFSELLLGCGEGMGCNYGPDQVDVLSVTEVEVVAAFLDYIDGDSFSSSGRCEDWDCDGYLEINSSDIGEQLSDTEAYEALLEAIDLSWAEEMTKCTGDGASMEGGNRGLSGEDGEIPVSDGINFDLENICSELELEFLIDLYSNNGFSEQNSETFSTESSYKNQQTESDGWNSGDNEDILFSLGLLCPAEVSTREAITEDSPSFEEGTGGDELGKSFSFEEIEFLEQFIAEENREPMEDVASGEGFSSYDAELKSESGLKHEECHPAASQETQRQEAAEDSAGTTGEGLQAIGDDESSSEALVSNLDAIGKNKDQSSSKEDTGTGSGKLKLKLNTARRTDEDDEEVLKPFNPRSPNFLSVEPDPEAEKVDLRHQEMEERRNSEDWMIDHALQEIVTKLAPARKKKVALIVEAIESVVTVPMEPSPVKRSGDIGFVHDKSVQACS